MKQTQNALKFLLAQYRAIYKHAYVKGLATAVLLTAGLAAGQAQAADIIYSNTKDSVLVSGSTIDTSHWEEKESPLNKVANGSLAGAVGDTVKGQTTVSGGSLSLGTGAGNDASGTKGHAFGGIIVAETNIGTLTATNNVLTLNSGGSLASGSFNAYGAYVNASGGGNVIATENKVYINDNFTITSGDVFGARAKTSDGSATVSGNSVNITADTLTMTQGANGIVGALAESTDATRVIDNHVTISSSGSKLSFTGVNAIGGGHALNQNTDKASTLLAQENTVDITKVSFNTGTSGAYIYGGRAQNYTDATGATNVDISAINNTVSLTNTSITTSTDADNHLQIVGNFAVGFAANGGALAGQKVIANGNGTDATITIKGGTFTNNGTDAIGNEKSAVMGGYANTHSGSATANNNIVDISSDASFAAIDLNGAVVLGNGAGNNVEATGNKLTITDTNQRTHADDSTQAAITETHLAGAWVNLTSNSDKSSLTATNNAVIIKNTSTEATKQKTIEGTIYGANVQGGTSGATFTVTGNTVDVGANIKTTNSIYGAATSYNGTVSNNAVTFDGTMQAAADASKEIVGAKIVTGDTGSVGDNATLTVTGNTVTIDSNAVLRNVNVSAVDLAKNNASNTDVIHSGNNTIVNGIYEINDSDGTNDTYRLDGDDVTIGANATVYVKNGTLNISGIADGNSTAANELYYNGTGSADASAKIVNADTINIYNAFKINGEDSLIASKKGAVVTVNAGKAAPKATDIDPVTDEKATLYISQTALANYLTATENKTYSLYDNQTVTDAAGALEVISGGTVDFGATVTLNDFDFAKGKSSDSSIEAGKINVSNANLDNDSGAYFRADNVVLAHALVTDNSKLKDDLSNLETYKFDNTDGIAIEANVLTLGQSGLSSSQSAAITFGKATVRDEMNFIAATSGQDTKTDGTPNGTIKNDGFHLTSEVIGSHYMQTNTQDGLRTYFTAQSGVIKGPVTIEGTSGQIWIQDGNWTANSNVTVASGGKLTVGSGSAVEKLPDYEAGVDPTAPDATLVLSGLTLDVSEKGSSEVLVSGGGALDSAFVTGDRNSSYNPAYYAGELDTNASWETKRVALLDLTQGLTLKGDANNAINGKATITASNGGIVLLDADDLNTILTANDKATSESSGAFFSGSTSGAFIVNGSVTADFGDFSTSNNGFNLSSDGYLVAPSLTVQHANDTSAGAQHEDSAYITGTSNHVAFGGHILVDDLQISDLQLTNGTQQNPKPAGAGNYASVVYVDSGTLEIGHSLTSYNHTLALGSNNSSASMTFATDLAADAGEIDVDQIRVNSGSISFRNGTWDAESTTFNLSGAGTYLTVGGDNGEDADEFDTTATLKGQALIAAAGTNVNIMADGTATFATADFSALAAASNYSGAAVKVDGTLEISDATATTTGSGSGATTTYKLFGAEGSIAIAKNGILSFGKDATNHAIIADNSNYSTAAQVTEAMADGYTKIRNQGGELRLGFADSTTFQAEAIKQLKTELFTSDSLADGVLVQGGVLNIGDASFYGVSVDPLTGEGLSGYTGTWASLKDFSDIYGTDVTNDTLKQTNVKEIQAGDNVQGHWGSLSMTSGVASTAQVEIAGDTSLNYAAGNRGFFVSTADRNSALGAHVQGQKDLTLENGGTIGKISLDEGRDDAEKNWTVLNVTGPNLTTIDSIEALTIQGNSTYTNATRVVIEGNTTVTNDIKYVEDVRVYNGATLTAQNVDVAEVEVLNSHLKVNETFTFDFTDVIGGTLEAQDVVLNYGADTTTLLDEDLIIAGSGSFKADTFTFKEDDQGVVLVGLDLGTKGEPLADGTTLTNGTGYFEVGTLDLNGGVLAVDPAYGQDTSVAAVKQFKDSQNYTYEWNDVGVVNGQLLVGKNAALGIGATLDETRAAIAKYQTNGSLSKDDYGSILYLNGQVKLESNTQISLNANEAVNTVEGIRDSLKYNLKAETNNSIAEDQYASLGLGAHTAILMTEQAFEDANGEKTGTAVYFQKKGAVVNANGGEIVLVGAFDTAQKLNFFNDQDNNGIDIVKADGSDGSILVYTQNGFLYTTLTGKNAGYGEYLQVDREHAYATMYEASDPVVESLIAYHTERLPADATNGSTGDTGGDAGSNDTPAGDSTGGSSSASTGANVEVGAEKQSTTPSEQLLADNSTSTNGTTGPVVGVGGSTGNDTNTDTPTDTPSDTPSDNPSETPSTDNPQAPTQVAGVHGNSEFLDEVVTTSHGAPAEAAARLAIYGGAAQAALAATSSSTDAIAARLGVGSAAGLTIANNGQGATLWLAPVYKSHDSDGFDSQGLDYGVDLNLYGVALGADLEIIPGFTAGLMFNVGSGDVDGKGNTAANNTSNDFDYWGAALYGSYRYDALTVAADLSYTTVDNDLEATTGMDTYGKLESSTDSTAISFGVTAKYAFDFNTVEVAPHAGLRYTNVDLDDYTVTANGEDVAHFDAGSISVFSIPVGVTVAKEFQGDNWSVKPMFDLTLTGNFGDDEVDGTVTWTGVDNLTTGVSSEFLDNFTYGATLGLEAKTGSFSFGLGVNYTGSSNADEYGVNANARFVF